MVIDGPVASAATVHEEAPIDRVAVKALFVDGASPSLNPLNVIASFAANGAVSRILKVWRFVPGTDANASLEALTEPASDVPPFFITFAIAEMLVNEADSLLSQSA